MVTLAQGWLIAIVLSVFIGGFLGRLVYALFFRVPEYGRFSRNLPRDDEPRMFDKPPTQPEWTPPVDDPYWQEYVRNLRG